MDVRMLIGAHKGEVRDVVNWAARQMLKDGRAEMPEELASRKLEPVPAVVAPTVTRPVITAAAGGKRRRR